MTKNTHKRCFIRRWSYSYSRRPFNQTAPGSTVLLSSLRSLKQCSRNIQLLRSSPNKTTYLQHILKRHSHQSCINFRSRYKTEPANLRIISEKKDLLTRGSRLCRIWIGIQHLQENFSCSLLPSKVRLHARKSPGYCVSHLDVQGRKCVNVRKRILSAKYHYWHQRPIASTAVNKSGVFFEHPHSHCYFKEDICDSHGGFLHWYIISLSRSVVSFNFTIPK